MLAKSNFSKGIAIIKRTAKKLPNSSGVYKMMAENNEILYIGKAKYLNKRVFSYSNINALSIRIKRMISLLYKIEFIKTNHEANALLLEASLIKQIKPKYNILLRDDKTYPHILIRKDHEWAQLIKHRGAKKKNGTYFGPFASASSVNITLNTLQKVFPLRTCSDNELANRTRACLQYQIGRCSAPCVNEISIEKYSNIVKDVKTFLSGNNKKIYTKLNEEMECASKSLRFEEAAKIRDRIKSLADICNYAGTDWSTINNADIFSIIKKDGISAIEVMFCRGGKNFGSRTHYPIHHKHADIKEILSNFIAQFYSFQTPPSLIIISEKIYDLELLRTALNINTKEEIDLITPHSSHTYNAVKFGLLKAEKNLAKKISEKENNCFLLSQLQKTFSLINYPERIEVFDNSHTSGLEAIGGMIVFDKNGFNKKEYRKFNIKLSKNSDDYGMMSEVIKRRFNRLNDNDPSFNITPSLLLIDGGKGQLSSVIKSLTPNMFQRLDIIAISKGKNRNAGNEKFYNKIGKEIFLKDNNALLYYLQRLRDEAHRFAINTHRLKRGNITSELNQIPNIGAKRRKQLILYFGSVSSIKNASIYDLQKVPTISLEISKNIYSYFNE